MGGKERPWHLLDKEQLHWSHLPLSQIIKKPSPGLCHSHDLPHFIHGVQRILPTDYERVVLRILVMLFFFFALLFFCFNPLLIKWHNEDIHSAFFQPQLNEWNVDHEEIFVRYYEANHIIKVSIFSKSYAALKILRSRRLWWGNVEENIPPRVVSSGSSSGRGERDCFQSTTAVVDFFCRLY